jgi:hypothetical protein
MPDLPVANPRDLESAAAEFQRDQMRYTRAALSAVELEAEILNLVRKWEEQNNGVVQQITVEHQEGQFTVRTVNLYVQALCILPPQPRILKAN